MMTTRRTRSILALAMVTFPVACFGSHGYASDLYAGKRLTILINYAAGGPADIEGRFFARHLAKHIPGRPTVIVQNKGGAGGMIGANYLAEIGPKDGTMLGLFTGTAWNIAIDRRLSKTDLKTFEFVAYQPSTSVYYMRTDVKPGIRKPSDLAKAEGLVVGGLSAESSKDILLRLTLDLLGVKYQYVTGHRGSNGARLAMQRGEISFYSESPPSYRTAVVRQLVEPGDGIGVFYDPNWDGQTLTRSKQVDGLPIRSFPELYKEINGNMPSGKLWDTYLSVRLLTGQLFRIAVFPPGTPRAAVDSIRVAINSMVADKDFEADAIKSFDYVPEYIAAPGTNKMVREKLTTSNELKEFIANYIAAGGGKK